MMQMYYSDIQASKKVRINLNLQMKVEQKVESDETHKTIEEDRKYLMQVSHIDNPEYSLIANQY